MNNPDAGKHHAPLPQHARIDDPIQLRDHQLRAPWHTYLFDDRVTLPIEMRARQLGVNENRLASELVRAEELLKSLLIVPLVGEREGVSNQGIKRETVEALFRSPNLMCIPAVANFVGAAEAELSCNPGAREFYYNNRNTSHFILLRQRLEDALVDLGVTQRIYNVRPRYEFAAGENPDIEYLGMGDSVRFGFRNGNELTCILRSGRKLPEADRCPMYSASLSYTQAPGVLESLPIPARADLGWFDPALKSIQPTTDYGIQLEKALRRYAEGYPDAKPSYFVSWRTQTGKNVTVDFIAITSATLSIFPCDPSELAILKIIENREAQLARTIEANAGLYSVTCSGGRVKVLRGEDSGMRYDLKRLSQPPYFEVEYFYADGRTSSKSLTIQEWISALEREVRKREI